VPIAPGTTNGQGAKPGRAAAATLAVPHVAGSTPIAEVQARRKAQVTGRVVAVRVQPWGGAATLEATLSDGTGQVTIVFLGRRHVGGVKPGALMTVEGVLGTHGHRVAMLNPIYEFLAQPPDGTDL
jgi:RecG-like helicase